MTDDFPCCSLPAPKRPADYARIAVLQTEREHLRRELTRLGDHSRTGRTPMSDRYDAIDRQIKEGLAT